MGSALGPAPGLGPVFEFEWLTATRRWQGYALRSLFVLFLLAALVMTWVSRLNTHLPSTLSALAEVGRMFYVAVMGTELTLVLLAAPAATAGSICLDKARGTLTHLLVTDLTAAEIVLGKLAARLVPVLGLIFCSLPVLALLTLLGGVDPDAMLGAILVTVGVACLGCALALVFSLWAGKTHEALLATYAVWALWLLGRYMVNPLNMAFGLSLNGPPATADPMHLAFAPYWYPGQVGWVDYLTFLGVAVAVSAGLTGLAIFKLRPVCTRVNVRKARRTRWGLLADGPKAGRLFARLWVSVGPSLDVNPVLWREWHRNRPSGWTKAVGALFATLAATFSVISVVYGSVIMMVLVNGFQVAIGLLILSVSAATSLAEERVRGSLDVLLTTPMSTRKIVVGKWLGTFRSVFLLSVLPALVVVCGAHGGLAWGLVGGLVMVGYVTACGAAVTSLGLAMATWCSRLGRAVGLTVAAYVVTTVGWVFLVMALFSPTPFGWTLISGSPFYGPILITIRTCEPGFGGEGSLACAVFWVFAYGGLAVVLLLATIMSFNNCLGRIEDGILSTGRRGRKPVVLIPIEEGVGPEFAQP